jgi:hypothetical protein
MKVKLHVYRMEELPMEDPNATTVPVQQVTFCNVILEYPDNVPIALRNISWDILVNVFKDQHYSVSQIMIEK